MSTIPSIRITRLLVISSFLWAVCPIARAQILKVVSPSEAATVEGDGFVTPSPIPLRFQFLFPASDFAGLPASHRLIVSWNYRSDRTQHQQVDWRINEQIWLSTTDKSSSTLSNVFDENHGADNSMVFDGIITYPLLGTGPTQGPRDFADGTRFQTPFYYDPSEGNLLVDKRAFGGYDPIPSPTIDRQETAGVSIVANDDDPTSPTGSFLFSLPVTQFEFAPINGDFNFDGQYTCDDVDPLVAEIAAGTDGGRYDLNSDGQVDLADRDAWLAEAGAANLPSGPSYLPGDANLDGEVDGSDFGIWNGHKFTNVAAWCSGDFTADGAVDGSDFDIWNANKFTASAEGAAAVPEPALGVGLLTLIFLMAARRCAASARMHSTNGRIWIQ